MIALDAFRRPCDGSSDFPDVTDHAISNRLKTSTFAPAPTAVWGLAFKPNTDDMREAPSRVVVAELTRRGARVQAYDPVAMPEAKRVMGDTVGLTLVDSAEAALKGADALLIVTEWREFRTPDFDRIKADLKQPLILDGRNLYEPELMRALGIEYVGVGRGSAVRGG